MVTKEDSYLMINSEVVLWTMVNAIKELKKEINENKEEIKKLKEKNK